MRRPNSATAFYFIEKERKILWWKSWETVNPGYVYTSLESAKLYLDEIINQVVYTIEIGHDQ